MEDFIPLNVKEYDFVHKFKKRLENRYKVDIFLPDNKSSCKSSCKDVVFGLINGKEESIDNMKSFIASRTSTSSNENKAHKQITVITLSDGEESSTSSSEEEPISDNDDDMPTDLSLKKRRADDDNKSEDDSICIVESVCSANSANETEAFSSDPDIEVISEPENSVCVVDSPPPSNSVPKRKQWYCRDITASKRVKNPITPECKLPYKVSQRQVMPSSSGSDDPEVCEVTSTTGEPDIVILSNMPNSSDKSLPCKTRDPTPQFIPLRKKRKRTRKKIQPEKRQLNEPGSEIQEKQPVPQLRPIVIDGSNVARAHGIGDNTFSSKGIQLCVDYFLDRGHTQITAFVPNFRRHAVRFRSFPTTDAHILEELAKKQYVVFTPSNAYDDRFMLNLAVKNGGVIVSNDTFRDLFEENETYKEVISQRLLKYCFVRDTFMVPDDPGGRYGPGLQEFLSFPLEQPRS